MLPDHINPKKETDLDQLLGELAFQSFSPKFSQIHDVVTIEFPH
jgi:hypothetical protein